MPNAFRDLFSNVNNIHSYNTRLAARQPYYLPSVKTNYGKLNLRFIGAKIRNTISDDNTFKEAVKSNLIDAILIIIFVHYLTVFLKLCVLFRVFVV